VHKTSGCIVGRFPTEKPFYTYHHVNAWEEPQANGAGMLLHVDVVAYDQPIGTGGYDDFTLQKLRRLYFHAGLFILLLYTAANRFISLVSSAATTWPHSDPDFSHVSLSPLRHHLPSHLFHNLCAATVCAGQS
jgi:carotenoid cleavage dioxygenase-like enzyme